MIWPNDVASFLFSMTSGHGMSAGLAIIAGISIWYSAVFMAVGVVGAAVIKLMGVGDE